MDALKVLEGVSYFQLGSEEVKRYEGCPHVEGDNVAEHVARAQQLVYFIRGDLEAEFGDQLDLVDLLQTIAIHDFDEVVDGFDIPTFVKDHNVADNVEIRKVRARLSKYLDPKNLETNMHLFEDFRRGDTLEAQLAKVIDCLVGNQLVVEQKIGLVNADYYLFCLAYVRKWYGISHTLDYLIEAQVTQMKEIRQSFIDGTADLKEFLPVFEAAGYTDEDAVSLRIEEVLGERDPAGIDKPIAKKAFESVW